ncbi:hypothetical protein EV361DRAFT_911568 [Lentinula raphanica]|nr:hypothetical protein EV361DRAFT_911568 [Lentinula raphanica]
MHGSYGWSPGYLPPTPQSVHHAPHGQWISGPIMPYPQPTPKLTPVPYLPYVHSLPATPSWIMTPLPPAPQPQLLRPTTQFQYPAPQPSPPRADDLPPLILDPGSNENDDDDDVPIATTNYPTWGFPPSPSGALLPYGQSSTLPVGTSAPTTGVLNPQRRRKKRHVSTIHPAVQSARMRAMSETSIPILHIPRSRVEGRPSHWRLGYRPTASTRLKDCFSKLACVSSSYTLHWLISYKPRHSFPLLLDLRCSFTTVVFHNPDRHSNTVDFQQLATNPPTHEMQLYHPSLPWYVDIKASTSSGITIGDLLEQLCLSLEANVVQTDYYNNILCSDDREQIVNAYHLRNGGLPSLARGIRRVDFLRSQVLFRGLTWTGNGWLIKTTSTY